MNNNLEDMMEWANNQMAQSGPRAEVVLAMANKIYNTIIGFGAGEDDPSNIETVEVVLGIATGVVTTLSAVSMSKEDREALLTIFETAVQVCKQTLQNL